MAMKGMLQGLDASGHAIPGAAPSAAVTVLAASLRPLLPPELVIMVDAMLCSWPQYPCPCPVNPSLDKDVRVSLQVVLILEFHGRDPQRLSDFPMFFQWLAWFSMSVNPDPNNYRTALAGRAARRGPPERALALYRQGRRHGSRPYYRPVRHDLGWPLPGF